MAANRSGVLLCAAVLVGVTSFAGLAPAQDTQRTPITRAETAKTAKAMAQSVPRTGSTTRLAISADPGCRGIFCGDYLVVGTGF
jgi:hypothetical protein